MRPAGKVVVTGGASGIGAVLEPDEVAEVVVARMDEERFLILPHPEVAELVRRKVADHDRWLAGTRRLMARAAEA